MNPRFWMSSLCAVGIAMVLGGTASGAGQTSPATGSKPHVSAQAGSQRSDPEARSSKPGAKAWATPKTPWGDPDLQGVWTYATMTPLERARDQTKAVLTEQEATDYENELSLKENNEDVAKIKRAARAQAYEPSTEEQTALRKTLLPVHKQMESRIGKNWIDAVYKEAAAAGVTY